jgi:hypothetical protein
MYATCVRCGSRFTLSDEVAAGYESFYKRQACEPDAEVSGVCDSCWDKIAVEKNPAIDPNAP